MATENLIKSRIQLKNDTEENWSKAVNFCPKPGELIIYSADDDHPYPRLKVGDGITMVPNLPFIDASTLSGIAINNIVAKSVAHKLTFGAGGAFVYDGSEDVTIPVYTGEII